jgi:predicted ABC-type ATPase
VYSPCSGKTTFAKEFLPEVKIPFVNADEIAMKLSGLDAGKVRLAAGRREKETWQKQK